MEESTEDVAVSIFKCCDRNDSGFIEINELGWFDMMVLHFHGRTSIKAEEFPFQQASKGSTRPTLNLKLKNVRKENLRAF